MYAYGLKHQPYRLNYAPQYVHHVKVLNLHSKAPKLSRTHENIMFLKSRHIKRNVYYRKAVLCETKYFLCKTMVNKS